MQFSGRERLAKQPEEIEPNLLRVGDGGEVRTGLTAPQGDLLQSDQVGLRLGNLIRQRFRAMWKVGRFDR